LYLKESAAFWTFDVNLAFLLGSFYSIVGFFLEETVFVEETF